MTSSNKLKLVFSFVKVNGSRDLCSKNLQSTLVRNVDSNNNIIKMSLRTFCFLFSGFTVGTWFIKITEVFTNEPVIKDKFPNCYHSSKLSGRVTSPFNNSRICVHIHEMSNFMSRGSLLKKVSFVVHSLWGCFSDALSVLAHTRHHSCSFGNRFATGRMIVVSSCLYNFLIKNNYGGIEYV
jgi:hypothetical protein